MKSSEFLFCIDETEGIFCFSSKEHWDAEQCLDDQLSELPNLPKGFHNSMEAMWEYYNPAITDPAQSVQEGKKQLLAAGFVWSEDMNQFINSQ